MPCSAPFRCVLRIVGGFRGSLSACVDDSLRGNLQWLKGQPFTIAGAAISHQRFDSGPMVISLVSSLWRTVPALHISAKKLLHSPFSAPLMGSLRLRVRGLRGQTLMPSRPFMFDHLKLFAPNSPIKNPKAGINTNWMWHDMRSYSKTLLIP